MRWPWSTSSPHKDDRDVKPLVSWSDNLNATDWSHYTEPRTVIPSVLLTLATLATIRVYKRYLRRIPDTKHIKPDLFRRRSLFGTVTSVGDGDNFRLFHTPGGRFGGWGWLPRRMVPTKRGDLVAKTVCTFPWLLLERSPTLVIDPYPHSRHRCSRTCPLRPPGPAIRRRSPRLADFVRSPPPCQGVYL